MKVDFEVLSHKLTLKRYPEKAQRDDLQAWDAADEYVIEYIENEEILTETSKILILNDQFGALGCCLSRYKPTWYSDSIVANLGLLENAKTNQISVNNLTIVTNLEETSTDPAMRSEQKTFDLVILKLPKNHRFLEYQLAKIKPLLNNNSIVIGIGKVQSVQKNVLSLFEKYIGNTYTSLAKKKARLIFSKPTNKKDIPPPSAINWRLENTEYTIINHNNVFSGQKLDIGARFMLAHMPDCNEKSVIDLGCGNGVLGLIALLNHNAHKVIFVDESAQALKSAQDTVSKNAENQFNQCQFIQSNCLEQCPQVKAQLVLCNPPFHQQQVISDHIAWQMFTDAYKALSAYGELRVVANRHLGYQQKLKKIFGGAKLVASNPKFVILSATKYPK